MCKNPLHSYTVTMKLQKRKLRASQLAQSAKEIKNKQFFATKIINQQGINLTKDVNNLYTENYKALLRETEKDTMKWKDIHVHGLEEST